MTDSRDEILAVLRKQEAALLALLETTRQAIKTIQFEPTPTQPLPNAEEGRLMNRVARVSDAGELATLRDTRQSRRLLADAHCDATEF